MSCESVREELVALLDGELDDAAAEAVRRHLQSCTSCEEERGALVATREALDGRLARAVPVQPRFDDLWAAATAESPAPGRAVGRRGGRRSTGSRPGRLRAAALAVAAAAAVVVFVGQQRSGDAPSAPAGDGTRVAAVERPGGSGAGGRVPAELREHPDMFVDFVIVRRLDKLRRLPDLLDDPDSAPAGVGRS